jgi:lipid II:glycine glycyltransferase (peptidoglycan interpeptide bridge formation enzyme)
VSVREIFSNFSIGFVGSYPTNSTSNKKRAGSTIVLSLLDCNNLILILFYLFGDLVMLESIYTIETDTIDKDAWSRVLLEFDDANIYQTWSYGAIRWGEKNLSHLLLKKNGDIVAAAQARIVKLHFLPLGIAYIRWGGMWQRKDRHRDQDVFRQMIIALRQEYGDKRGLFLRVLPNIMDRGAQEILDILKEEGFEHRVPPEGGRSLYIDLRGSLDDLRANLKPKWRYYLKKAEKSNLSLLSASEDKLFDVFIKAYREMKNRKGFTEYVSVDEFRLIQQDLDDPFKMKVLACQSKGEVHAVIVSAALGNKGIYVLGATSDKGLKSCGSYLLQWKMIEYLKTQGYQWYDLGGYDPVRAPGTAHFKRGLAGKKGIDCWLIGQFDICTSRTLYLAVRLMEVLRMLNRRLRKQMNRFKKEAAMLATGPKIFFNHR